MTAAYKINYSCDNCDATEASVGSFVVNEGIVYSSISSNTVLFTRISSKLPLGWSTKYGNLHLCNICSKSNK